ncbi:MAG: Sec-independent protein translocase protein TatB [Pseudomonadota bacterium]
MFDVGFGELLLVGVIALAVLGPERLPRAARTAGLWLGRARATAQRFTAEIDRELRAEELRQALREQAKQLTEPVAAVREELSALGGEIDAAVSPAPATVSAGQTVAKRDDGT